MKLSAKVKLATVGVAAVIGIGGGGVVYHHAFKSNPVAVNEQVISAANAVTEDSSTKVVDQTDTTPSNSSPMNGASIPTKGEANRFEEATDGYGVKPVKIVKIKDSRKVVRELLERSLSEEDLEKLPVEDMVEAIIEISENIEITENGGNGDSDTITQVFESEYELEGSFLAIGTMPNPLTEEELKQKVASGEFTAIQVKSEDESTPIEITWYMSEGTQLSEALTERLQEMVNKKFAHKSAAGPTPLTATESPPSSAHSVLTPFNPLVDSTVTSSETSESTAQFSDEDWAEVEKLLSEFSDEDWAELERLLRDPAVEETVRREEGAPLNAEGQQQIEKGVEKTPVDPSVRQEIQHQRRLPLKSDTDVLSPKTDRYRER